jgi:hypothetical protein
MSPTTPFWFKQRQCQAEPAGSDEVLKVTGPNLGEAYLRIFSEEAGWKAALRRTADGPDVATCDAREPRPASAWEAAFELYRTHLIL